MERVNNLEGFNLHKEHDNPESVEYIGPELIAEIAQEKVIFCSEHSEPVLEGAHYIWVDPDYCGILSPGQRKAYEIMLEIQQRSIYCITTLGKLAAAQGLDTVLPCTERLGNLQSLGAISGFRG